MNSILSFLFPVNFKIPRFFAWLSFSINDAALFSLGNTPGQPVKRAIFTHS
jgi:hypothetical protein